VAWHSLWYEGTASTEGEAGDDAEDENEGHEDRDEDEGEVDLDRKSASDWLDEDEAESTETERLASMPESAELRRAAAVLAAGSGGI
jgi:hypothetical protein